MKEQRKYKHSVANQLSLVFIGLMVGVIIFCIAFNQLFLTRYYVSAKKKIIVQSFATILSGLAREEYGTEELQIELNVFAVNNNVQICIVDKQSISLFNSENSEEELTMQLMGYILGVDESKIGVHVLQEIEQTDSYVIRQVLYRKNEYMELYGRISDDITFLMRTPMESIRESSMYANRFFFHIGMLGTLIGALIIRIAAKKISKPILELNDISERMVEMNFEARYQSKKHKNEIDLLGENVNELSDSLKKTISELKNANYALQQDIKRREELDQMRQDFVSAISHELKTPLALIQGYAEGLEEGMADDPQDREYYCSVIIDEASKMNKTVCQLMDLNELEFGSDLVHMERFDITLVIQNYLQSARKLAQQNDIELLFTETDPIYVWADEYRSEEVLQNFYSNAIHYCQPNQNGQKIIRISLEETQDKVRISVYNTGSNIPEESISRLWEKFYKVDKARTREYGGSGVGLSIVKAIQDAINQNYGVENRPDGVVFWFELGRK